MAQLQNYQYFLPPPPHFIPPPPYFPPSPPKVAPPPPRHGPSPPPPPPSVKPPPPPHTFSPPPPPHPITPPPPPAHPISPPPHPISPPPPPPHIPTPPPPPHHSTVIIFVFLSIGGVFFLAFVAAALFCFIKKRKKTAVEETDRVRIDKHIQIHEDIVPGPHGTQTVVLTIDEDVHVEEEIIKTKEKSNYKIEGGSASVFNNHHHHHSKE